MFGRKEIAELQLRKRLLIVESDLNRLALRAEWQRACTATDWIRRITRLGHRANAWLVLAAPLLGAWTARRMHRKGGFASRLLAALKWIPTLIKLWQSFAGPRAGEGPSKSAGS